MNQSIYFYLPAYLKIPCKALQILLVAKAMKDFPYTSTLY